MLCEPFSITWCLSSKLFISSLVEMSFHSLHSDLESVLIFLLYATCLAEKQQIPIWIFGLTEHHNPIECNLFSSWYSWKIAHLVFHSPKEPSLEMLQYLQCSIEWVFILHWFYLSKLHWPRSSFSGSRFMLSDGKNSNSIAMDNNI
jgi:hypothetical protein